jgi:aspartate carbamoyltransferase regulatory subunit
VAKISEGEVTAELHDTNGTVIEKIATTNKVNVNELVILLANNTDRAVAFKNLNVEALNHQTQPVEDYEKAVDVIELLAPYATFIILVATVFAAAVYAKKRKRV